MKKSRAIRLAQKRAAKAARMGRTDDGKRSKSNYAKKLQRKAGHGRHEIGWMWWLERGALLHQPSPIGNRKAVAS